MYGTVLDQRVFEHLVQRCLPLLHDHFAANDIQLSVASLPWFLSLYISSMPMVFAFRCVGSARLRGGRRELMRRGGARRIIDCFFLMGPKVLFQVGYGSFPFAPISATQRAPRNDRYPSHSLAILKLNSPELLETTDDGAFIKCVLLCPLAGSS